MNALLAVLVAATLTLLPSTALGQQVGSTSAAPVLVPVSDLQEHSSAYVGTLISTRGKVEDVYSAHVFTIEENRLFDIGHAVIVVIPEPDAIALQSADVSVVGIVRLSPDRTWHADST